MTRREKILIALAGVAGVLYLLSRTEVGQMATSSLTAKLASLLGFEEGERLSAYQDTGGAWTIGKGHKILSSDGLYPYTTKKTITQAESNALFDHDTAIARAAVARSVTTPITLNQKAALSSLAYNIGETAFGTSTLVKKLNAGDIAGAAAEFARWIYDNGVVNNVLVARRAREKVLFLT